MAYRNKIFCTLNTKPSLFLFSYFSCTRPVKNRWCSPLQQKCLTEVRDAKRNRGHKAEAKIWNKRFKSLIWVWSITFLWLLRGKKSTFFFSARAKHMSRNLQAIYNLLHFSYVANRGTWYFFAAADRLVRQDQSDEASSCVRFPEVAK